MTSRPSRRHLGSRWLLFGGSWGSTLALAYTQALPGRVSRLRAPRSISRQPEEVRLVSARLAHRLSRRARQFRGFLARRRSAPDVLGAYLRRLTDPDPAVHMPAARAWSVYEGSCSTCCRAPIRSPRSRRTGPRSGWRVSRRTTSRTDLFLPPGGLLAHMDRIGHIPAEIVQGRYDMVCPACTAFDLAAAWPAAQLTLVPGCRTFGSGAGHPAGAGRGRRAVPSGALTGLGAGWAGDEKQQSSAAPDHRETDLPRTYFESQHIVMCDLVHTPVCPDLARFRFPSRLGDG